MKEKKDRDYGGIDVKYDEELTSLSLASIDLANAAMEVMDEIECDDLDIEDLRSDWMNGPYRMLPGFECDIADLEARIKADSDFTAWQKKKAADDLFAEFRKDVQMLREIDAYVMSGVIPSRFKKGGSS